MRAVRVLARLRALPGVEASAKTSQIPLGGDRDTVGFHAEGRMAANPETDPSAHRFGVAPDYLRVMRIPLVRGRGLTGADVEGTSHSILVNQTAARQVWGGGDPIGQRVKLGGTDGPWWTVVGVVGDVRHLGLDRPADMQVYVPHAQWAAPAMILTLRTTGPPLELAAAAERAVRRVDSAQAVSEVIALDQLVVASVAGRRTALVLLAAFAGLALLLAAVGIYGVTSYAVALRTHEIGIRLAVGADPGRLLASIVGRGASLPAGIAIGAAAALVLSRLIGAHLYGVSAADQASFAAAGGLLVAVAAAACYVPARRVLAVEPTEALRGE